MTNTGTPEQALRFTGINPKLLKAYNEPKPKKQPRKIWDSQERVYLSGWNGKTYIRAIHGPIGTQRPGKK